MVQPRARRELPEGDNTGHPLLRAETLANDMMARLKNRDKPDEFKVHELEEWKKVVNRLAATNDGQAFIRAMLQYSSFNLPGDISNTVKMVEDNGKQAFYKRWVRPYLDKALRTDVEP